MAVEGEVFQLRSMRKRVTTHRIIVAKYLARSLLRPTLFIVCARCLSAQLVIVFFLPRSGSLSWVMKVCCPLFYEDKVATIVPRRLQTIVNSSGIAGVIMDVGCAQMAVPSLPHDCHRLSLVL